MNAKACKLLVAALLMVPAAGAYAQSGPLFPPATASCYLGAEIAPSADAPPYRKPAVPVTAVRLERSYPQLVYEATLAPRTDGGRLINLRVIATFADAGQHGGPKRYANGLYDLLVCSGAVCDANNYRVEAQADSTVLLRMTGGLFVGGGIGSDDASRHLPDGHIYRLVASPMAACR